MILTPLFLTDRPMDLGIDHAINAIGPRPDDTFDYADIRLGYRFLNNYRASNDTVASYRRELEKLFQWRIAFRPEIPIRRLRADDLEEFFIFCGNPPAEWMNPTVVKRMVNGMPNPEWKPFMRSSKGGRAAQRSLKSLFAISSSFYDYLTNEGASEFNPVLNIRQKSKFFTRYAKPRIMRLSNKQTRYLFSAIDDRIQINPAAGERDRWVLSLLLFAYLRISELVKHENQLPPCMDIFRKDEDGYWWLSIFGKGRKERYVTADERLIESLVRYRRYIGLSDYPYPGEKTPLIPKSKTLSQPLTSTRYIRDLVDAVFNDAHEKMVLDGLKDDALELSVATVHWLRHTGISEDVKRRPKEHVKEDAGHASMATTDNYIDIELKERARSKNPARPASGSF